MILARDCYIFYFRNVSFGLHYHSFYADEVLELNDQHCNGSVDDVLLCQYWDVKSYCTGYIPEIYNCRTYPSRRHHRHFPSRHHRQHCYNSEHIFVIIDILFPRHNRHHRNNHIVTIETIIFFDT